jgi:hypothetical protein
MSKNLTRKGLALGALVALGSSVIAGPAYAVDPVSLVPTTGTAYTTIIGETFNLKSQFTDAAQLASETLKFVITDSSEKLTVSGVTRNATTKTFITTDAGNDPITPGAVNDLAISATSATGTTAFSVTVQAWLDFDASGTINNGEAASEVRTVKFVPASASGAAVTWSALTIGDASASAKITFNSDINVNQLTPVKYGIAFGKVIASGNDAGKTESAGGRGNWVSGSTDSGDSVDVDDATAATALVAKDSISTVTPGTYVAQALVQVSGGVYKQLGDAVYYTPAKVVAYTVDAPNATVGDNVSADGRDFKVRTGTKSLAISAKVTKSSDATEVTQVAAAGIVATVTVSVDTIDSADTISVGGVSFAGAKGSKTFTATSDADGKFNFTVESLSGAKNTNLYVTIKVAGLGSTRTVNYRWVDATITAGALTDTIVGSGATRQIVKGGAVSIKYALKDDFGKLVSGSNYRLQVVAAGTGTDATTARVQPTFVDGYATASFTDGSTAAGTVSVVADLQVLDANNAWVSTYDKSLLLVQLAQVSVSVKVLAVAPVVNAITIAKSVNSYSLDAKDFVTGDSNYARVTRPAYTTDATTISGDVVDVLGAGIAGQEVTVSAAGIQLESDGVYAVGSITVVTGTNGVYTVSARSHTAGKVVFTATTGSVSKTVTVTFNAAAANSGTKLVVDAPASAVPGKSVTVKATLTDKWGNVVDSAADKIAFTATGAGYFVGTLPTQTDAEGVASATFVTQPGDAGTVKFSVKYSGTDAEADYLTTSASTVFAAAVVVDPSASVATVTVTPAATTSQAGRALDVTVKAVDASGAAVAGAVVALSSTGAGSLSATSVVTDAAGTATVKLVAGASDLGSATVKAVSNTKSGSAVVEFGATDASVDLIGKRVYVTTEFAAGKRVTIYDNGVRRYSAIQTSDAEKVVMWNVKAGSHTIVVKISGASSDSVTFLVK